MIFVCLICKRTKIGKHDLLRYTALNDNDERSLYEGKLCKKCAKDIEEVGLLVEKTETES